MYKIDTSDFSLLFEPYIDHGAFGDKNIERLRVRVTSYGFSADATMLAHEALKNHMKPMAVG